MATHALHMHQQLSVVVVVVGVVLHSLDLLPWSVQTMCVCDPLCVSLSPKTPPCAFVIPCVCLIPCVFLIPCVCV